MTRPVRCSLREFINTPARTAEPALPPIADEALLCSETPRCAGEMTKRGAPRPIKMGTIASLWRYDAARQATPQLAHIAKVTRALYHGGPAPIVILASPRAPGSSNVRFEKRSG
jgi:hypothetical protein